MESPTEPQPLLCQCGCNRTATMLCTGSSPEGAFVDLPCCTSVARYLSECCAELDLRFESRLIYR